MDSLRRRVFSNISWNLVGSILRLLISFFVSIITAKYLGPSNYGVMGYVVSFSGFFSSICNLGINAILVKELLEDEDRQGTTLGSALFMQGLSTMLCALTFCGLIWITNPDEPIYLELAGIQSVYMICNISHTLVYWFQSRMENKITTIAGTVGYIAMAVYRIFLLATGKSLVWFAWATTLDIVVVGAILLGCYCHKKGPNLQISWEKCKSIFSKSRHFVLAGLMVSLYAQMDKVMLKGMIDSASVGYYTTAASVNTMWTFVIAAIIDSVSPVIYKAYDQNRVLFEKYLKMLYAAVVWLCIIAGVMICLLSDWMVKLLYGAAYIPSAPILRILVWSAMFSYLGVAKNIWIVKEGKNKYLVMFTALGVGANLLLNLLLIPKFGPLGAAIATLVAQMVSSVLAQLVFDETRYGCILLFQAIVFRGILSKNDWKMIMNKVFHKH